MVRHEIGVLVLVPLFGSELGQPRAVADHALEHVVRDPEPGLRPVLPRAEVAPGENERRAAHQHERGRVHEPRRSGGEDTREDQELEDRGRRGESAAHRERLDGLRLEHSREVSPDSVLPRLVRIEAHRSHEQSALQEASRGDRHAALVPRREHPHRNHRREQEPPGEKPTPVDPPLQSGAADEPPRDEEEPVVQEKRPDEDGDELRQPRLAHRVGQRGSRTGPQAPEAPVHDVVEMIRDQVRARPPGRVDPHRLEEPIDLGSGRSTRVAGDRGGDLRSRQAARASVGAEHSNRSPSCADDQEEASLERDDQRSARAQRRVELRLRDVQPDGLDPAPGRGGVDPGGDVFVPGGRHRRRVARDGEARVLRQREESFAEPSTRPHAGVDHEPASGSWIVPARISQRRQDGSRQRASRAASASSSER